MSMIKANDFFFLSGIHDHVLCSVRHSENKTYLTFVDEKDQNKAMVISVYYTGNDFLIIGPGLYANTSRARVLGLIREHINYYFPLDA